MLQWGFGRFAGHPAIGCSHIWGDVNVKIYFFQPLLRIDYFSTKRRLDEKNRFLRQVGKHLSINRLSFFVLYEGLLVFFNTRTLLRLCHWPNAVMSATFNGYLTDLTVKGKWHNRSKVHSQTLFFTLRCCFPSFIPSFYVLFRIFPLTRLFTFCQYKFQEIKKVELVVM